MKTKTGLLLLFMSFLLFSSMMPKDFSLGNFKVVCAANFHDGVRTPGYCVGMPDTWAEAQQMAKDHNAAYEGHSASATSGAHPFCD